MPHLLRLVQGPDHRWLLIATGLLGAAAPVAADMVSRNVIAPLELPIGIISAMISGPACLWLLLYGSGKTILLRDLTAEIAPARGRVMLNGRAIAGQSPAALPRRSAVLPQHSALSFAFTAAKIMGIWLDPLPLEGVRG
ncbi:MAG: iron chelate uptake ABC transporter family permease subunit [Paracoccus sp.]|nr:iron chelate uptake ABC transporter family permease subunit [Paracoccus sp. (in: a-proteobacteria)]